jgi:Kef-type K+ transport system membrane component KefB
MSDFLQLITLLSIILVAAKLAGFVSTKINQPSVFGELLVGVLLGPSLLNITHWSFITDIHLPELLKELGEIGVLLLMFLAGLELHLKEMAKSSRVAALSGILGVITPIVMALGFGRLIGLDFNHALFLGLTLGATSVSISVQVLIELKVVRSKVGLGLLGAAIFDDVLVILLLSTVLAVLTGGSGLSSILLVFSKMVLFFAFALAFGLWLLPWITRNIHRLSVSQGITTFALIVMLVFGLAAELVGGMAAITGAFLAGMMFARTPEKSQIDANLHSIAYAFFVPIFFVGVGLNVDLHVVTLQTVGIILALVLIAATGKLLGAGSGALLSKFSFRESMQLGIGMISRGEVGLIIANVGLTAGFITNAFFSSIIATILICDLITPPLLRAVFNEKKGPKEPIINETDDVTSKESL